MQIMVFSDSHGKWSKMDEIIYKNVNIKNIIFLGDGDRDIEKLSLIHSDRNFYTVCGNCDKNTDALQNQKVVKINGIKIFICHGHTFNVNVSSCKLEDAARFENCQIALYGHTHIARETYENGLHIINPGSISSPRDFASPSYARLEIGDMGILSNIIRV